MMCLSTQFCFFNSFKAAGITTGLALAHGASDFALETCVVLDPVHSGKALYHFMKHVLEQDPEKFRGKNILFWHTGTT
jgi:1-aminocyclopropane-1-carboxylate deaminase/D-cysteine desulfhydrase-like pyridoxal-dependent ACC family enzyme